MVMEIIREGLIITPTGSLEPSQGSYDVPVTLENDDTYTDYTISMYVGYYVNGVLKKRKCETDSEGHYLIPGIAFLRSGIISISFLLETADKSQGLMTNALSYEIKHAPNVVVEVPADPTWQELVKEWIQELAGAVNVDNTLTKSGMAADAKATGDAISKLSDSIGNLSSGTYSSIEPMYDDIPIVFFDEAIPQTKDDVVTAFRYISKTMDISGYAEFKAQGNSSMSYPKKNMTVKMYKDEALTEKLKVDFKGWGKQRKHVYKANWIDLTHSRNIVSARLWSDIVKSRSNYEELPEELRASPNQGVIDGFPIKVYSQGVYQGRYTLNIPKDAWMANMDDSLEEHCILCGENYNSGCFRATANIDGTDWTDEVHDTVPTSIKTRWNEVINFIMNSTDEEFKSNLGDYFYVDSLIDYLIFGIVSCGLDAFGKNQLYLTYDGLKWIAEVYDLDSTWGLYYTGAKFVSSSYSRTEYEDFVNGRQGNLLYIRLAELFYEDIQERYENLKQTVLSIPNIINHFERFIDVVTSELVKEDFASTTGSGKFTGIPSQSTNNIQQIREFALARQAWTDEYVANLTASEPEEPDEPDTGIACTGITLDKTELIFDGEGTQTITATVEPSDTTDPIVWISNSQSVATVENGVVAAIGNGDAVITAVCGDHSASCNVSVSGFTHTIYAMTRGYSLDRTTGELTEKEHGFVSDYVDATAYKTIHVTFTYGWYTICGYDADHNFVKTLGSSSRDELNVAEGISIDNGVKYIRMSAEYFTAPSDAVCTATISEYTRLLLTNGLTIKTDGTVVSGNETNYALENYFEVSPGEIYVITCNNPWLSICGYDGEKVFVSTLNTATASEKNATITIPEGVNYIRWGCTGTVVDDTTGILKRI